MTIFLPFTSQKHDDEHNDLISPSTVSPDSESDRKKWDPSKSTASRYKHVMSRTLLCSFAIERIRQIKNIFEGEVAKDGKQIRKEKHFQKAETSETEFKSTEREES